MRYILILFFRDITILLWPLFQRRLQIYYYCIAPSKTFNLAGLSTSSVIISNHELRKSFRKTVENLHIGNGNIFGTIASIAAYSEGDDWLDSLLEYIDGNIEYVNDYCRKMIPEIIPVKD